LIVRVRDDLWNTDRLLRWNASLCGNDVLAQVESFELPTPSPKHDLKSLVYSIYGGDLIREGTTNRPGAALSLNEEITLIRRENYMAPCARCGIEKQLA
jgi:hypothetical protein